MNLRQAAQQALEALEYTGMDVGKFNRVNAACAALRAALAEPEQEPISLNNGRLTQYPDGSIGVGTPAEPEQEPVAWMWRCKPFCNWPEWNVSLKRPADSGRDGNKRTEGYEDVPLYTAPTPRRPLTDEELEPLLGALPCYDIGNSDLINFARAVIAAYEAKQGKQT